MLVYLGAPGCWPHPLLEVVLLRGAVSFASSRGADKCAVDVRLDGEEHFASGPEGLPLVALNDGRLDVGDWLAGGTPQTNSQGQCQPSAAFMSIYE